MFLDNGNKADCYGCEACVQVCSKGLITMSEDDEGFRYPVIDKAHCINCGLCRNICPNEHSVQTYSNHQYVFGGYHNEPETRFESTSGGAFSAIVDAFCDKNYVIFGAEADGISVFHSYITDKKELKKFRKSKYSQSIIGSCYKNAKNFLKEGRKVVFSGTPCQIAGLISFLEKTETNNLLTVEVVCEGVPSPNYIHKYDKSIEKKGYSQFVVGKCQHLFHSLLDSKPL